MLSPNSILSFGFITISVIAGRSRRHEERQLRAAAEANDTFKYLDMQKNFCEFMTKVIEGDAEFPVDMEMFDDTIVTGNLHVKGGPESKGRVGRVFGTKFSLTVLGDIKAGDIHVWNLKARDIDANSIGANDVLARDVKIADSIYASGKVHIVGFLTQPTGAKLIADKGMAVDSNRRAWRNLEVQDHGKTIDILPATAPVEIARLPPGRGISVPTPTKVRTPA